MRARLLSWLRGLGFAYLAYRVVALSLMVAFDRNVAHLFIVRLGIAVTAVQVVVLAVWLSRRALVKGTT